MVECKAYRRGCVNRLRELAAGNGNAQQAEGQQESGVQTETKRFASPNLQLLEILDPAHTCDDCPNRKDQ
jgi:hypothetical protein